jgi:hypothetical protein
MHVAVDTPGAAVMHVADIVADIAAVEADMAAADTVVDTAVTTARVTGLAPAFRCQYPLLVAGKPVAQSSINLKISRSFAAS